MKLRHGVGLMILNQDHLAFVGERIDTPNAWQMPQGGINKDESKEHAALREMKEEIGTNNVRLITMATKPIIYQLPHLKSFGGRYDAQSLTWFLFEFTGTEKEIDLSTHHPEFKSWRWAPPQQLPDLVVGFKKDMYKKVLDTFQAFLCHS